LTTGSVILVIAALIIYIFTTVGGYDQIEDTVTKIYYADNISPCHETLIDRFNTEYKGEIELVPVSLPFSKFSTNDRKELLARTLRSRSSRIDIFAVDLIWVPRFARWCMPLDSIFTDDKRNAIIKPALESCTYNERLYAMPLYIDVGLMYYRKDIINTLSNSEQVVEKLKRSMTWNEFLELSKRLSSHHGPYFMYPANNFEGLVCFFLAGINSNNASIFSGDSIQLCQPKIDEVLQFLIDLVNKYKLTPSVVTKYDDFQCCLEADKRDAIFFVGWPGFRKHFEGFINKPERAENLGITAIPHFEGGIPSHVYGGWNLMISKHSENKDAAIKFIQFAQRPENQKMLYKSCGYLPIINSVYNDTAFVNSEPDLKFYKQLIDMGFHRPYRINYTKISDNISYFVNLAIKGDLDSRDALKKATQSINSDMIIIK